MLKELKSLIIRAISEKYHSIINSNRDDFSLNADANKGSFETILNTASLALLKNVRDVDIFAGNQCVFRSKNHAEEIDKIRLSLIFAARA